MVYLKKKQIKKEAIFSREITFVETLPDNTHLDSNISHNKIKQYISSTKIRDTELLLTKIILPTVRVRRHRKENSGLHKCPTDIAVENKKQ